MLVAANHYSTSSSSNNYKFFFKIQKVCWAHHEYHRRFKHLPWINTICYLINGSLPFQFSDQWIASTKSNQRSDGQRSHQNGVFTFEPGDLHKGHQYLISFHIFLSCHELALLLQFLHVASNIFTWIIEFCNFFFLNFAIWRGIVWCYLPC